MRYNIKGTAGITGLLSFRVPIKKLYWHLDVGSLIPAAANGCKGAAVRRLI